MKYAYTLIILFFALASNAQRVVGEVIDEETLEKLPFVSVMYNPELKLGTTTDTDGKFVIDDRRDISQIQVSYIGYQTLYIERENIPKGKFLIKLKSLDTELEEATVEAGVNPALRIVRNAIARADSNDPDHYKSFRFKSYQKNILTRNPDTTVSAKKQLYYIKSDTATNISRHLMVTETVSKSKFKQPNHFKEVITGTQISGFKNSIFAIGVENFQYFGLYSDIISVLTEYYLTPLAKGADKKYFYILKDTIIKGDDSTYIMYYQPKIGANFEGLKGEIHINTDGWAIEYVFAEPNYKSTVDFAIEHYYKKVDGKHWFPEQLTILVHTERLPLFDDPGFMFSELFIDTVKLNVPIPDEEFDHVKRELTEDAPYVNDEFWEQNRPEALDEKELKTYAHMDSIGERYKFDFFMKGLQNAYRGYFTIGKLEFKSSQIVKFTGHEGVRLGLGVYTNKYFSKKIRFGGYFNYGFRDEKTKYGGTLEYFFDWKTEHKIYGEYFSDVMLPGVVDIKYYVNTNFWTSVWAQHMDRIDQLSIGYTRRFFDFLSVDVKLKRFNLHANNEYRFINPYSLEQNPGQDFAFTEAGIQWRWAFRENITSNFGHQISAGTDYPVLMVGYRKGFDNLLGGQYNYNHFEAGVWLNRYIKGWGKLDVRLEAGYVDRAVPYQMLYSARSSYNAKVSVVTKNTFQTMRYNEFFSDKYAALYFNHNFGPLLFRTKWLSPEISAYHAMSFGTLENPGLHRNLEFKTLEDGFYESGIVLSNILHLSFLKVGYLGFGGGLFYRYGPNQLENDSDNLAFKYSIIYTIN